MNVEEAKAIVQELKGRFDAAFSSSDKERIEMLYWEVLGKEFKPTSCQQCYHDALIEIYLYLKKYNKMKEKSKYRMRAGFIINCPAFDGGKIYTNDNLTDDVAERYLAQFPQNVEMFQELPKDFSVKKVQEKVKKAANGKKGDAQKVKKAANGKGIKSSKNGEGGDNGSKMNNSKATGENEPETKENGKTDE